MTGLLQDKVTVVTGGSNGIGRATVERWVKEGAKVVIADILDDDGHALAKELGDSVVYVHADVTKEQDVEAAVNAAVERFGRLDVMYNNAGATGDFSSMTDLTEQGFNDTVALVARSVLFGHKHAARQFIAQSGGGSIISTTSVAGLQAGWAPAGYSLSKAAVNAIVRQSVPELARFGIRSNAIAPGTIMTPGVARHSGIPESEAEEFVDFVGQRLGITQPMGRTGVPDDIAGAATFFASDLSAYVTGQVLAVDGGATVVTQGGVAETLAAATAEYHSTRG